MKIELSKTAEKFIKSSDKTRKNRIKNGILGLIEDPPKGDSKQLQGCKEVIFRLRIGKYRITYQYIENNEITLKIIDIGSRGDIYKK